MEAATIRGPGLNCLPRYFLYSFGHAASVCCSLFGLFSPYEEGLFYVCLVWEPGTALKTLRVWWSLPWWCLSWELLSKSVIVE